ncbi:LysR family transcriptional regulator [Actinoallomurus sp. NPDC050550]|uniref:LysR family transcriptional regulator n=1 Tax=Actinoallomurus sp. NPDC050550 TaxID=3154937 RepID=UPI0033F2192B
MELRDIEIFLTLAEELHFGRTAARLHVSQARVSQAISQQERRLGGALFDRSNRRQIRLTSLGQQLRDDLRPVYAGLRDSLERARQAAQGITATLRVGMIPGNAHDLRAYWQTFRSHHPQWELRIRHAPFVDPFAGLRTGEVDALVTWLPVEEPDLTVGPVLFTDPRVLAVAADHELATRSSASLEMLADFQHTTSPRVPDYWADSFIPPHTPSGHMIVRGPLATNTDELFTFVSTGEAVNAFPAHTPRYWSRPDIAWLPFRDLGPLTYGMVWRSETENDPIRALARIVEDLGPLHPDGA